MVKSPLSPPQPIADAPVKPNESYGPCLVSPGVNGYDWALSEWDGQAWFTLDGDIRLTPRFYVLLPPVSLLDK
jgi:hypothetical protein